MYCLVHQKNILSKLISSQYLAYRRQCFMYFINHTGKKTLNTQSQMIVASSHNNT